MLPTERGGGGMLDVLCLISNKPLIDDSVEFLFFLKKFQIFMFELEVFFLSSNFD